MAITQKTKVIVTHHVLQRIKERFRLKFQKYLSSRQMLENLIIGQVLSGTVLNEWKLTPFYKNSMDTKYGQGTEIIKKSGIYFLCNYNHELDRLQVLTVVPSTLFYPRENSIVVATGKGAKWYNVEEYTNRLHQDALKEDRKRS